MILDLTAFSFTVNIKVQEDQGGGEKPSFRRLGETSTDEFTSCLNSNEKLSRIGEINE